MVEPMCECKIKCVSCQEIISITVTMSEKAEINRMYETGKFIQDILPNHTPGEREMFISQTCDDCWDKLFPEEEEEEL